MRSPLSPNPRSRWVLLLPLLAAPATALPDDRGAPLRWPDVVAMVPGLPAVREADARVEGAAGAASSAGSIPNPTVTMTGADAEARDSSARRREWGVAVEVPLDFLATRGPRVAAARALERAATVEAQVARAQALRAA